MNHELIEVSKWLKVNRLSLNINTSYFMLFHKRKGARDSHDILLDDHILSKVSHTKFLGVIVDDKLSWKTHIDHVSRQIAKGIGMLSKTSTFLSKKTQTHFVLQLYFSPSILL